MAQQPTNDDEPVLMFETHASEQAKRRLEYADIVSTIPGAIPRPPLGLDEEAVEQAREDRAYVNRLLSGEF